MTQFDHLSPVNIYAINDEKGDEIGNYDVCIQEAASHVADSEYAENVPLTRIDKFEVKENIDGN